MLTLWGAKQRMCDGITRRGFLKIGALGGALTLADLLRQRAQARPADRGHKSVIMIYLPGGPPHLDTYDLKPEAPAEFRGDFRPIRTNVPGIDICELFPRQAKIMDKLALIRSVVSNVDEHDDCQIMTGHSETTNRNVGHPSIGAVVSKLRDEAHPGIAQFISLRGERTNVAGRLTVGNEPGYLGAAHRVFCPEGPGLDNLKLSPQLDGRRLADRKALLASFDQVRRDLDASGSMNALDAFTSRAYQVLSSGAMHRALDLSREDIRVRERYGPHTQLLVARRLLEAGAGFVTLAIPGDVPKRNWDSHRDNFRIMRNLLPDVDASVATLVEDLHQRGLGQDVLVVMWGEFGRTPKINAEGGRDHWTPVMSVLLAGGGLKMGQVIGSSSARGEYPKDRPYSVQQVLSTIYQTIGIDPAMTFPSSSGRPVHLMEERDPVKEML